MKEITIDLLRHGDVANGKKLLGKTDEALSTLGWQQLRSVLNDKDPPWSKVITSPLQRCHAFSEEISSQFKLPLSIENRFEEMDFGLWDGQLLSNLYDGDDAELMMKLWQNPAKHSAPEGEIFQDFEQRVIDAWQALITSLLDNESSTHCLLVTHGGVIRTILRNILGFPTQHFFRIAVPYASLTRINFYDSKDPSLIFHNGSL